MRILHPVLIGVGYCLLAVTIQAAGTDTSQNIETLLRQVGPACLKAKDPDDLNNLTAKFSTLANNPSLEEEHPEVSAAITLLEHWKEYLSARATGNKTTSYNILIDLLDEEYWLTLMPRSEVLRLCQNRYQIYHYDIPSKNWTDLPLAIAAIEKSQKVTDNFEENPDLERLKKLQTLSRKIALKDWTGVMKGSVFDPREALYTTRFRQLLQAKAIAGYLKLDPKYTRDPENNETVDEFLTATEKMARKENDWITIWRVTAYLNDGDQPAINRRNSGFSTNEMEGLDCFLIGQQLESVGKNEEATLYYRLALSAFLAPSLVEVIHQKLRAYQEKFPEQWALAKDDLLGGMPITRGRKFFPFSSNHFRSSGS